MNSCHRSLLQEQIVGLEIIFARKLTIWVVAGARWRKWCENLVWTFVKYYSEYSQSRWWSQPVQVENYKNRLQMGFEMDFIFITLVGIEPALSRKLYSETTEDFSVQKLMSLWRWTVTVNYEWCLVRSTRYGERSLVSLVFVDDRYYQLDNDAEVWKTLIENVTMRLEDWRLTCHQIENAFDTFEFLLNFRYRRIEHTFRLHIRPTLVAQFH